MKYFSENQLKNLSFPDAPVSNFTIDEDSGKASFVSDAFVGTSPGSVLYDDSLVEISKFSSLEITEEDSRKMPYFNPNLALREICEFTFGEGLLIIKGFSKGRGLWTEFKFCNPNVVVSYEEE
jgi:hypothetical protein